MSVVQNPLIGRARQKLGGTVFTTWKGINVIKGKPLTVANPRTDGQLMRRSAMRQTVDIARQIAGAINFGFKEQAVQKSAFNAFVGYSLRNAFDYSAPPTASFVAANMLVSQGTISSTPITNVDADAGTNLIKVDWSSASLAPGQSMADKLMIVVADVPGNEFYAAPDQALRSDNTIAVTVPAGLITNGGTVHVWLFAYNTTSRKSGDSVHSTAVGHM